MPVKVFTIIAERFSAISRKMLAWAEAIFSILPGPVQMLFIVIRNSISLYWKHDTSSLGSGLSYYTIFSIAPLFIIVVSATGAIFGPQAVTGELKHQIEDLLGSNTADMLQAMVKAAYQPGKNWIATTLSIAFLITGAIGVFDQLRTSLNIIWDVKPLAKKPFIAYILDRLFSFAMIACIAFLLLVSLAINTVIAAFSGYLNHLMPTLSKVILSIMEIIISFGLSTMLFAYIYKFMSDIKMKWANVFYGAIFTSLLFAVGKYLISLYVSKSNLANTYGVASSVIVVLLWVYYSSQIVFFGAEFTRSLAEARGVKIKGIGPPPPSAPAS